MADGCGLCGMVPHVRSCAWRLAGWRLPLPRELPTGGPREAPPPPLVLRSPGPPPRDRERLTAEAARLHDSGLSWREVGAELGIPQSTASEWVRLARPGV